MIQATLFGDDRGFFMETYDKKAFDEMGIEKEFVLDGHSRSRKGILRGLHFQKRYPQAKLVRIVKGAVYDVAVDIRESSPTYKEWFAAILTEEDSKALYLPRGFAHGFLVLSNSADILYKCSDFYRPDDEGGIIWNDPDIAIDWPLKEYSIDEPILSDKDQRLPSLRELEML